MDSHYYNLLQALLGHHHQFWTQLLIQVYRGVKPKVAINVFFQVIANYILTGGTYHLHDLLHSLGFDLPKLVHDFLSLDWDILRKRKKYAITGSFRHCPIVSPQEFQKFLDTYGKYFYKYIRAYCYHEDFLEKCFEYIIREEKEYEEESHKLDDPEFFKAEFARKNRKTFTTEEIQDLLQSDHFCEHLLTSIVIYFNQKKRWYDIITYVFYDRDVEFKQIRQISIEKAETLQIRRDHLRMQKFRLKKNQENEITKRRTEPAPSGLRPQPLAPVFQADNFLNFDRPVKQPIRVGIPSKLQQPQSKSQNKEIRKFQKEVRRAARLPANDPALELVSFKEHALTKRFSPRQLNRDGRWDPFCSCSLPNLAPLEKVAQKLRARSAENVSEHLLKLGEQRVEEFLRGSNLRDVILKAVYDRFNTDVTEQIQRLRYQNQLLQMERDDAYAVLERSIAPNQRNLVDQLKKKLSRSPLEVTPNVDEILDYYGYDP